MEHYKQLFLSIGSTVVSIAHLIIAAETRNAIAWFVGVSAGLYAIYASYTTAKLNKRKIKLIDEQLKNKYSHGKN